jgi:hypothetical protein
MTHVALSPFIEFDASTGVWLVAPSAVLAAATGDLVGNGTDPLWTESNWPPGVHATVWPFPPSNTEPVVLFLFSAAAAIVTLVAVAVDSVMRGWRTELHRMSE